MLLQQWIQMFYRRVMGRAMYILSVAFMTLYLRFCFCTAVWYQYVYIAYICLATSSKHTQLFRVASTTLVHGMEYWCQSTNSCHDNNMNAKLCWHTNRWVQHELAAFSADKWDLIEFWARKWKETLQWNSGQNYTIVCHDHHYILCHLPSCFWMQFTESFRHQFPVRISWAFCWVVSALPSTLA